MQSLIYAAIALVAALMGMGVVLFLGRLRKWDAEKEAAQILERAELEAKARRKDAEIEAKDVALAEKSRVESELNKVRDQLREQERGLDKRGDALGVREEQLAKQEQMVEANQRRLADKIAEAADSREQLQQTLAEQR
ncbi:MAG: Rnase Y domain-containing protein, partial [Planctomycetota bacterium]